ncbi:MAG TPA: UDP-N-acetylglucosamine 2-epimerase [Xanthomonadaceae bacterium]|nr:UDP-N-acetylglucosamine 2-epimerase [Xanthomonadaceae bacterium]
MDDAKLVAASAIALAVTLFAIFSLRPVARRLGLVDRPDERKRHRGRVPLIGGLCFFLGMLVGLVYLGYIDRLVAALLVPAALIVMTGLVDDLHSLSVRSRLVVQGCVVFIVIAATGIYLDSAGRVLGSNELRFGLLGIPLTIFAVIGLINAFNMLDGIDGLAASQAMASIAAILLYAHSDLAPFGTLLLLQVLFAALVPYLCVNLGWPDGRKIFMGDAGSTLIGFLLGWSLIFLSHRGVDRIAPVDALWCVALPVMDTLAVMARRMRDGRSPFKPDRQHLHHLLLEAGCTPRQVLLLMLGASAVLAAFGAALRGLPQAVSLVMFCAVLSAYVLRFDRILAPLHAWRARAALAEAAARGTSSPAKVRALCVMATPADAAQIAPIARQLAADGRFESRICVAGGEEHCPANLLSLFDLAADIRLDDSDPGVDATGATSQALDGMKRVLADFRPDVVLVPGYTPAAAATTLAAFYQQVPVVCIEPESARAAIPLLHQEADRKITCTLASLHLAPHEAGGRGLLAEGVPPERIVVTGNTAVDTLRAASARMLSDPSLRFELGERLGFLRTGSPLLLVADPRITNRGFEALGRALRRLAATRPELDIVYTAEPGGESAGPVGELMRTDPNIHSVPRGDVLAFAYLLGRAHLVLAGCGETASDLAALDHPVLLVQGDAAIAEEGAPRQVPVQEDAIVAEVARLLADPRARESLRASTHDADAAPCQRVAETLASLKDGAPTPGPQAAPAGVPLCSAVEDLREAS